MLASEIDSTGDSRNSTQPNKKTEGIAKAEKMPVCEIAALIRLSLFFGVKTLFENCESTTWDVPRSASTVVATCKNKTITTVLYSVSGNSLITINPTTAFMAKMPD
jgi:hypothetical protein